MNTPPEPGPTNDKSAACFSLEMPINTPVPFRYKRNGPGNPCPGRGPAV